MSHNVEQNSLSLELIFAYMCYLNNPSNIFVLKACACLFIETMIYNLKQSNNKLSIKLEMSANFCTHHIL